MIHPDSPKDDVAAFLLAGNRVEYWANTILAQYKTGTFVDLVWQLVGR